jgi:hypothetical protein
VEVVPHGLGEETQIQVLDRAQPLLHPGRPDAMKTSYALNCQAGIVNLVLPSEAGMIGGLISVGRGLGDGRRGAVVQGVPVPGGDH